MPGIKTASLELSKRLQELTPGWDDTQCWWELTPTRLDFIAPDKDGFQQSTGSDYKWRLSLSKTDSSSRWAPKQAVIAPDLDWLLGKLGYPTLERNVYGIWLAKYYKKTSKSLTGPMNALGSGSTPCDAACALLIKLLESQVITV